MKKIWKKCSAFFQRLAQKPLLRLGLGAVLVLMMTALQWLQLDLSCGTRIVSILSRRWFYSFVDMGLVFIVDLFLLLVTRRWRTAYILGGVFFFIWGVANHYTQLYSGNVLTLTALRSVGTAMDVLGGYRLSLDLKVIVSVFGLAVNVCASLILGWLWPGPLSWRQTGAAAGSLVFLLAGAVAGYPAFERITPPPCGLRWKIWRHTVTPSISWSRRPWRPGRRRGLTGMTKAPWRAYRSGAAPLTQTAARPTSFSS